MPRKSTPKTTLGACTCKNLAKPWKTELNVNPVPSLSEEKNEAEKKRDDFLTNALGALAVEVLSFVKSFCCASCFFVPSLGFSDSISLSFSGSMVEVSECSRINSCEGSITSTGESTGADTSAFNISSISETVSSLLIDSSATSGSSMLVPYTRIH
jgi:hypothetical protein